MSAGQKEWQALVDTQDKARKAMADARAGTPLQRLMRRIQAMPLCPLCKREECECWQPLTDADKEHAALAGIANLAAVPELVLAAKAVGICPGLSRVDAANHMRLHKAIDAIAALDKKGE